MDYKYLNGQSLLFPDKDERNGQSSFRHILGDCTSILPTLPTGQFDLILTDPPYPLIKRSYGFWSEEEWLAKMRKVVPECMRLLKPTGSAIFILQPNSQRVGRMSTWLWEFMLWVGKEWGIVQDAWWWNIATLPQGMTISGKLLRPSLKACVWVGPHDCYRNQDSVLWEESMASASLRLTAINQRVYKPSGHGINKRRMVETCQKRGGVTPFNVLPIANANSSDSAGTHGHGAGTPQQLTDWWIRYLLPPGGMCLDPFSGTGTVGLSTLSYGGIYVGIERDENYHAIASDRLAKKEVQLAQ